MLSSAWTLKHCSFSLATLSSFASQISLIFFSENRMSEYTLQNESKRIFDVIVGDERLNIPDEVKDLAHTVKFAGDETQPFFPVPYKCAEAQSSVIGVVGLFANAIGKARYGIVQEVEVDV